MPGTPFPTLLSIFTLLPEFVRAVGRVYADIMTEFSHTTTNLPSVMLQFFAFRLAI